MKSVILLTYFGCGWYKCRAYPHRVVGLLIPHLARLLAGPGNARLLPVSASLGAIFLLCADGLARTLTTTEIPLGILTELLGIPAFVLVLRRARHGWTA